MPKASTPAPSRARALKELQTVPGVGPNIAAHLWNIGIRSVADLRGADPERLYEALCRRERAKVDRCALYVLRCAVYYASRKKHDPQKLLWWNWQDKKGQKNIAKD
jgi:hypothetical protein